jgi:hypothetical protein
MHVAVIMPAVRQFVDQGRIAMESEDHRLVGREQIVEVLVLHPVRVLRRRLQHHQIHHVDDAEANIRNIFAQQGHGGHRL